MADMEKVIEALENCTDPEMLDDDETYVDCIRAGECPWDDCQERGRKMIDIPLSLVMEALESLKAQEPHVITMDDFSRCDDFGYIPAVFEPRNMTNFMDWEWRLVTKNALSCKEGRYWSGLPTDEQREAVKWE